MKTALFLFTSILFISFCFSLFVSPIFAQTQPSNPYIIPNTNADVPKNLHTWTQNVMLEVVAAMSCQLSGIDPTNPHQKCLGLDQKTKQIGFVENGGGAVGLLTSMITQMYKPPFETGDYVHYLASNFGTTKSAYAATTGIGFDSLNPLLKIWVGFRNIAYLVFVLVFIVIGVAIMLRVKIDPRTVMSVENQIPRIILTLIFITFSFAIAGFLVDIMWTGTFLTISVVNPDAPIQNLQTSTPFSGANQMIQDGGVNRIAVDAGEQTKSIISTLLGIDNNPADYTSAAVQMLTPPIFNTLGTVISAILDVGTNIPCIPGVNICIGNAFSGIQGAIDKLTKQSTDLPYIGDLLKKTGNTPTDDIINIISEVATVATLWQSLHIPNWTPGILGFNAPIPVGPIVASVATPAAFYTTEKLLRDWLPFYIPYFIILLAMFFALFRVWIALIKAFVFVLIDVTLAPVWIMFGAIPGSSVGFGSWLRDISANLIAFPVTAVMFSLGARYVNVFSTVSSGSNVFIPPFIGTVDPKAVADLIGLGIILMAPTAIDIARDTLKAPQFKYTSAIGQAVGAGSAVGPQGIRSGLGSYFASKSAVWNVQAGGYKQGGFLGAARHMFGLQ